MKPLQIAVIGGGPGGIFASHLLPDTIETPHAITLFEASDRLGGKVLTGRFHQSPVTYEIGAAKLYDYSQLGEDPLKELILSLGLPIEPLQGGAVYLDGKWLDSPEDLKNTYGTRAFREFRRFHHRATAWISPQEYYESDWKADNEDRLARVRFSRLLDTIADRNVRRYIEVSVHSDVAAEPHQTTGVYGLQNWLMNDERYMHLYKIPGGNDQIVRRLLEKVRIQPRMRTTVERIGREPNGKYRVVSRIGDRQSTELFDAVIVALPNQWLPQIQWEGESLRKAIARHHTHYDHPAHYLRVSVLFDRPFWHRHCKTGYFMVDAFNGACVYDESPKPVQGSPAGAGVLGWLIAGTPALITANKTEGELLREVLASLPPEWGSAADHVREVRIHRWVGSVNALPGGMPVQPPEQRHQPAPETHPDLYLVGDYLFDSTLNGVLDSAELAVEMLAKRLETRTAPALPSILAKTSPSNTNPTLNLGTH